MAINVTPTEYTGIVGDTVTLTASGDLPVVGCPIGETFYEGGTSEYPFSAGDFSSVPSGAIYNADGTVTIGAVSYSLYSFNPIPAISVGSTLIYKIEDITPNSSVSGQQIKINIGSAVFQSQVQYFNASGGYGRLILPSGVSWYTNNAGGTTNSSFRTYKQSWKNGCIITISITIKSINGGNSTSDVNIDFTDKDGNDYDYILISDYVYTYTNSNVIINSTSPYGVGANLLYNKLVGQNLPYQCTGETTSVDDWTKDGQSLGVTSNTLVINDAQVSDSGDYQASASGQLSNVVTVVIEDEKPSFFHQISFDRDGETVNVLGDVIYPINTTIALSMKKSILSGGKISWRDLGRRYDNYKTTLTFETDRENGAFLEKSFKEPSRLSFTSIDGFAPFTPLFDYGASPSVEFGLENATIKPKQDLFGKVNHYELQVIPAYNNIYSVFSERVGSESPCYSSLISWYLDDMGMVFPQNDFKPDINEKQNTLQLNGNYSLVDKNEIELFETTTVVCEFDEPALIKFLSLITIKRDGIYTMTVPEVYSSFGQQHKDNSVFKVILADEKLSLRHINYSQYLVTFKLQLVEVVS